MNKTACWFLFGVLGAVAADCVQYYEGDVNHDCRVDVLDLSLLARNWLAEASIITDPNDACPAGGRIFYAEPNGPGHGADDRHPMSTSDFWEVARPGDTLMLLDGVYRGQDNMIQPTGFVHGLEGLPITIRAQNEGKATIDGQGIHEPVKLFRNSYLTLCGFNAFNSAENVVLIERSHNVNVKKVCAWDARDANRFVFWARESQFIVFEDCAGWGIGRKIFVNTYYGDFVTFRRCWASWDGSHHIGPKMAFSSYYDSIGGVVENCVGTWTESRMQDEYYLMDDSQPDGFARDESGNRILYTNGQVEKNKDNAIFGYDGFANIGKEPANVIVRNCISYTVDKTPQTHYHARPVRRIIDPDGPQYECLGYYRMYNCLAWQGEYGNGSRLGFSLEAAEAFDARVRFPQSVRLTNGATITYAPIAPLDESYVFPLPIHDRVMELTGHDMTRYFPHTIDNEYHAAPRGTGSGRSETEPMSIRSFFYVAQ